MKLLFWIICIWLVYRFLKRKKQDYEFRKRKEEERKPLTTEQIEQVKRNIKILEQGITLQEYLQMEDKIKMNGQTKIYNKYGFYVIFNETKKVYLLDGGEIGFSISTVIHQMFLTNNARGNGYMNKHYLENDRFVIKFHPIEGMCHMSAPEQGEFNRKLKEYYDLLGESYLHYNLRMKNENA